MFRLFEIRDGKFTTLPDIKAKRFKDFILSSVIVLIIVSVASFFKIDEKHLWKIYNLIIQHFDLGTDSPRIDSEKELEARVELEVDRALREVEDEYDRIIREADKKYAPRYVEEENDEALCYTPECKALAPPMRICSAWDPTCPDTSTSGTEGLTEQSESAIINELVRDKPPAEPGKFRF
jgi:hypothetical protein